MKTEKIEEARPVPFKVTYRRNEARRQLERLRNLLASDLPRTERVIVERQYERLCRGADSLSLDRG